MICTHQSCTRCHFSKLDELPRLKFHQGVGYPDLSKHGYVCKKDVTEVATIVDQFNYHFTKSQHRGIRSTGLRHATDDTGSENTEYTRRVHYGAHFSGSSSATAGASRP